MDIHTKEAIDRILTSITNLSSRLEAIEGRTDQGPESIAQAQTLPLLS